MTRYPHNTDPAPDPRDDPACFEAWSEFRNPGAATSYLYPPLPTAAPAPTRRPRHDPREDDGCFQDPGPAASYLYLNPPPPDGRPRDHQATPPRPA